MSDVLSWISGGDDPEHLEPFTRLRAQRRPDPYNPDASVEDWTLEPDELPLEGAWSSGASSFGSYPVRLHLTTSKQIVIFDPTADVREGDRVRDAAGSVFTVTGRPEADRNPWTGWQPTLVLSVEEVTG